MYIIKYFNKLKMQHMDINKLMETIGLFNCLFISNYNTVKLIKTNFRTNFKNSDNAERWERPDRTSKRKKLDLENVALTMRKKSIESIHSYAKKNTKIKEELEQHLLYVDKKKNKLNERKQQRALETLKDESEERELNKFQANIQQLHRQIINNIAQENEEIKNMDQENEEIKNMDQENEEIKNMERGIEDERDRFEQNPIDTEEEINPENEEEKDMYQEERVKREKERDNFEEERAKFEQEKMNRFVNKIQIEVFEKIKKIRKKGESDKSEIEQKLKEIVNKFEEERSRFKLDLYILEKSEEKLEEDKSKFEQEKKEMEERWFTEHEFRCLEEEKYLLQAEKSRLKEEKEKFEEENRFDPNSFYLIDNLLKDYEDDLGDYEDDLGDYEDDLGDYEYYKKEKSGNSKPEQGYKKINGEIYSLNAKRDRLKYFYVIDLGDGIYRNFSDELDSLTDSKIWLELRKNIYALNLYIFERKQARFKSKVDIFEQYINDIRENLERRYKGNI
uniref:Acetyl-CoA carboxylase carboxyltransferase beta subunit n=1 Tax=Monotropa uniflora TaxID=50148 RepID=A0A221SQZ6_MONUN|nr:acetyl-CoA carboxylase carboxyltransferase beta subunit [Monotropa uniflora]ASN78963.1 acetyl-CoA carboxylase carboxyltransferase beta subunit [Monotropa uniflora]